MDNAAGVPKTLKYSEDGKPTIASLDPRTSIVIGRDVECDVVIKDAKASRRHCRLTRTDDGYRLEDLGSKNGTLFQGERITAPVTLKSRQTFQVGEIVFYLA